MYSKCVKLCLALALLRAANVGKALKAYPCLDFAAYKVTATVHCGGLVCQKLPVPWWPCYSFGQLVH